MRLPLRSLRPRSLRSRLATLFALGTGALLVASALFLYVVLDGELRDTIDDGLRARAGDVAAVVTSTGGVPDGEVFAQLLSTDGAVIDASAPAIGTVPVLDADEVSAVVATGETFMEVRAAALDGRGRALATPVTAPDGAAVLVVASSLETVAATRNLLVVVLGGGGPLLVLVLAGGGWWLAGAALRPVDRMTTEADAISAADPDRRLAEPSGDDEIARLGRTLNAMLDRIAAAVAHERQFLDDASHELRTPISILRAELELALAEPGDRAEVEAALRSALDEAERLSLLASDLLVLARAQAGRAPLQLVAVDVAEAARVVVGRLRPDATPVVAVQGVAVEALADPERLDQILVNVVGNAIAHARATVIVDVDGGGDGDGRVRVSVADDGPGFPADLLDTALDRFSRSGVARGRGSGGAGLGLAIVAALVAGHRGRVEIANGGHLGGAVVTLTFLAVS